MNTLTGTTKRRWKYALGLGIGLALLASLWWGLNLRASLGAAASDVQQSCALPPEKADAAHPGMVWVPAGEFLMGDTVYPEEQAVVKARVQGFWMDRTEVTNAQFAAFVKATGYVTTAERPVDTQLHPGLPADMQQPGAVVFTQPSYIANSVDVRQWWHYVPGANWRHPGGPTTSIEGKDAHPVVAVTIEDAQAYARWAGRELPTEREWEWAARAKQTQPSGNTQQPEQANTWQGEFPVSNTQKDGFAGTAPVGCFAPNPFGLYDMIGNVWELTADRYTDGHRPSDNAPPDQPPLAQRPNANGVPQVIKGGSYLCAPNYCMRYRAGARQPQEADLATNHIGFRTILRKPAG